MSQETTIQIRKLDHTVSNKSRILNKHHGEGFQFANKSAKLSSSIVTPRQTYEK